MYRNSQNVDEMFKSILYVSHISPFKLLHNTGIYSQYPLLHIIENNNSMSMCLGTCIIIIFAHYDSVCIFLIWICLHTNLCKTQATKQPCYETTSTILSKLLADKALSIKSKTITKTTASDIFNCESQNSMLRGTHVRKLTPEAGKIFLNFVSHSFEPLRYLQSSGSNTRYMIARLHHCNLIVFTFNNQS